AEPGLPKAQATMIRRGSLRSRSGLAGRTRERIHSMRARATVTCGLVGWLVLLWMGCSGEQTCAKGAANVPEQGGAQLAGACVYDADCQSGFCDRVRCNDLNVVYGHRCAPPAPDARPLDKLPERLCHGYLCLDGRCRSCTEDAECQSYYGVGKCTV